MLISPDWTTHFPPNTMLRALKISLSPKFRFYSVRTATTSTPIRKEDPRSYKGHRIPDLKRTPSKTYLKYKYKRDLFLNLVKIVNEKKFDNAKVILMKKRHEPEEIPISLMATIFSEMLKEGRSQDVQNWLLHFNLPQYIVTNIVRILNTRKDCDAAFGLVEAIEKSGIADDEPFKPEAYAIWIAGFLKNERVDLAKKLVQSMKNPKPNTHIHNLVIKGFAKEGRVKEILEMIEDMRFEGLMLDRVTYRALMQGYLKQGDVTEAEKVWSTIKEKEFADIFAYEVLFDGYMELDKIDEAISILKEMREQGHTIKALAFMKLINQLANSGKIDVALNLFDETIQNVQPPNTAYQELIALLNQMGRTEDATKYSEQLTQKTNISIQAPSDVQTTDVNEQQ